jgi:hypothetical protein
MTRSLTDLLEDAKIRERKKRTVSEIKEDQEKNPNHINSKSDKVIYERFAKDF